MLGDLILGSVPMRLVNIAEHPHSYGFPRAQPRMRPFLGVPILVDGVANGSLYLTEKAGGRSFTDQDEEAVVALTGSAGLAIELDRQQTRPRAP